MNKVEYRIERKDHGNWVYIAPPALTEKTALRWAEECHEAWDRPVRVVRTDVIKEFP